MVPAPAQSDREVLDFLKADTQDQMRPIWLFHEKLLTVYAILCCKVIKLVVDNIHFVIKKLRKVYLHPYYVHGPWLTRS
jgi:hypothetical protein